MRLLLDTHTIILFINANSRLPQHIRDLLEDNSNDVYISIISPWEISIKSRQGKLDSKACDGASPNDEVRMTKQ